MKCSENVPHQRSFAVSIFRTNYSCGSCQSEKVLFLFSSFPYFFLLTISSRVYRPRLDFSSGSEFHSSKSLTHARESCLVQNHQEQRDWASLVAQWLRICLLMQGTRVRALVWEDPTCRGASGPVSHNYWVCASGACAPQQERSR